MVLLLALLPIMERLQTKAGTIHEPMASHASDDMSPGFNLNRHHHVAMTERCLHSGTVSRCSKMTLSNSSELEQSLQNVLCFFKTYIVALLHQSGSH